MKFLVEGVSPTSHLLKATFYENVELGEGTFCKEFLPPDPHPQKLPDVTAPVGRLSNGGDIFMVRCIRFSGMDVGISTTGYKAASFIAPEFR
jgi:hypothetical protein